MPRGMKGIRISKITNTDRNITETNAGRGTRNKATPETGTRPAGNSDMDEDSDKDMGKGLEGEKEQTEEQLAV